MAEAAATEDDDASGERKARFFFTEAADVTMFREILSEDGLLLEDGCTLNQRWQRVHTALKLEGIDSTLSSMKARVNALRQRVQESTSSKQEKIGQHTCRAHFPYGLLTKTLLFLKKCG